MKCTRFKALNLGLERANNVRIGQQQPEVLQDGIFKVAQQLEGILAQHVAQAQKVKADKYLNQLGINAKLQELAEKALKQIDAIDPSREYEKAAADLEISIINRVAGKRITARDGIKNLDERQFQMLNYLQKLTEQAGEQHREKLAKHKDPLSDQERQFVDPVERFYLEATGAYSADKELFLSVVENAPWPIQLVPGAILEQGKEQLRQSIASDLLDHKRAAQAKLQMADLVVRQATDIARNPLNHAPIQTEGDKYRLVPDGSPA